jgi:hypothetical protein
VGVEQRRQHERAGIRLEADVVQCEIERPLGCSDERGRLARDRGRGLAAVPEEGELDGAWDVRVAGQLDRSDARFARVGFE